LDAYRTFASSIFTGQEALPALVGESLKTLCLKRLRCFRRRARAALHPSGEVAGRAGRGGAWSSEELGWVPLGWGKTEKEGARGGSDDASTARGMIDETKFSSRKLTDRAMETARFHQPPPPSLNFQRQRHTGLLPRSASSSLIANPLCVVFFFFDSDCLITHSYSASVVQLTVN
jgi:hypothetical protein